MMEKNEKKVVLITGASSGIGLDTAKRFVKLGYTVYGAARRTELLKEIEEIGGHSLFLDLTSDDSIVKCAENIIQKEGRVDILINNAGFGLGGALETVSMEAAKNQFEVNLFGLARLTQLILPSMRKNHFGRIVNVSSVAGRFSSPFLGWYHASKFALEAYSDALRMEVKNFGIKVSIVEPGLIQTDWGLIAEKHLIENSKNTVYAVEGEKIGNFYHHYYGDKNASDISVVSKTLIKASTSKCLKIRYNPGKYSTLFTVLASILPARLMDFFIGKIFKI